MTKLAEAGRDRFPRGLMACALASDTPCRVAARGPDGAFPEGGARPVRAGGGSGESLPAAQPVSARLP